MERIFRVALLMLPLFFGVQSLLAQDSNGNNNGGRLSGDLNFNANFYDRDTLRGASGISFYDNLKSGAEGWLSLNYSNWGFDTGIRFDLFNNSNRIFPTRDYTDQGIGYWFVRKNIEELTITGGYFYDQIGSGAIFRAYEQRLLGLDRSLFGLKAEYNFGDFLQLKAFTGKQKFLFDFNPQIIKGASADGYFAFEKFSITPGVGVVNRTLDQTTIQALANAVNLQDLDTRFVPRYNTYAFTVYNTLTAGPFDWFIEASAKTNEAVNTVGNFWEDLGGNFLYTTLSYSRKGFGITLQGKRTQNFRFRSNVLEQELQNNVQINFLPALNREHALLLLARYNAQAQELDEMAGTIDIIYSPIKSLTLEASFSNITNLESDSLFYRELFFDATWKKRKSPWKYHAGFLLQDFNHALYLQKETWLNSLIPFAEVTYKFSRKVSLRVEGEYLLAQRNTRFNEGFDAKEFKQDRNDWANGLIELTVSPHWSFALNNLYNVNPADTDNDPDRNLQQQHFYGAFVGYTKKTNRFSLFYGKRTDGIVCSGGVCRFEPAFSGVQFQMSTNF